MVKWYNDPKKKPHPKPGEPGYEKWAATVEYELKYDGKWPPRPDSPYYDVYLYKTEKSKLGIEAKQEEESSKRPRSDTASTIEPAAKEPKLVGQDKVDSVQRTIMPV